MVLYCFRDKLLFELIAYCLKTAVAFVYSCIAMHCTFCLYKSNYSLHSFIPISLDSLFSLSHTPRSVTATLSYSTRAKAARTKLSAGHSLTVWAKKAPKIKNLRLPGS